MVCVRNREENGEVKICVCLRESVCVRECV